MSKSQWVPIPKQTSCPVCKQLDWRSIAVDGTLVKCVGVEDGSATCKEDTNGARCLARKILESLEPAKNGERP
jgi:hypothetical protein